MTPNIPTFLTTAVDTVTHPIAHVATIGAREAVIAASNAVYPGMYTQVAKDKLRAMEPGRGLEVALSVSGTADERSLLNVPPKVARHNELVMAAR